MAYGTGPYLRPEPLLAEDRILTENACYRIEEGHLARLEEHYEKIYMKDR